MRLAMIAALLLARAVCAQDAPAASAPGFTAYAEAESCMRTYARRFAGTQAAPQDVADAALGACFSKRYAAAVEKAQRYGAPAGTASTQADEPALRRVAIMALLEARYPHAR